MNLMHESFQSLPVQTLINQIAESGLDKTNKLVISSPTQSKIKQLALQYVVWASAATGNFFGGCKVVWILFGRRPQDTPEISFRGKISPEELNSYDLIICDNLTIRSLMWCFYTSRQRRGPGGMGSVPFFLSEEKNSIRAYAPGPPVFAIGDYTFSQGHSFFNALGLGGGLSELMMAGPPSTGIERPLGMPYANYANYPGRQQQQTHGLRISGSPPAPPPQSLLGGSRDSSPSPPFSSSPRLFSSSAFNSAADDSIYEFVERGGGTTAATTNAALLQSLPPTLPHQQMGMIHSYPQENYFQKSQQHHHADGLTMPSCEAHPGAMAAAEREEKLLRCFDLKRELAVHMLRNFEIYGGWVEGQDMKRITLFEA